MILATPSRCCFFPSKYLPLREQHRSPLHLFSELCMSMAIPDSTAGVLYCSFIVTVQEQITNLNTRESNLGALPTYVALQKQTKKYNLQYIPTPVNFSVPALEHDVTLVEQYFTASGSVPVAERIVTSQVLEELGSRKIKDLFLNTQ